MEVDDFLDVGQSEAEALDVVYVAGVHAIELVEDFPHVFAPHALSVVGDGETELIVLVPGANMDVYGLVGLSILHGVVHQVGNGILEVHLVHIDGRIYGFYLGVNLAAGVLHTQGERAGCLFKQFIDVEFLLFERHRLTVEHRHLQYFLYEEAQAFRFVVDDAAQVLLHLRALGHALVAQHLRCQRDTADGGLQLVGHVVDEVVLDLCVALLAEDDHNGEDERDEEHQGEDDGRNHESHRGVDVLAHLGEVDAHHAHLRGRVVAEQGLCIAVFGPRLFVVRAAVHLAAVGCVHGEVIVQVDAVILQSFTYIGVQQFEVDALLQGLVAGRI